MSCSIKSPPSQTIPKVIRLLAILAVSGGALAFSVTHFAFPRVGFEGMLVLAGLAIWFSILCITGTFALGCFMLFRRRSFPMAWPLVYCVAAGLLIFLTVRRL
jgi:hypothetical protein